MVLQARDLNLLPDERANNSEYVKTSDCVDCTISSNLTPHHLLSIYLTSNMLEPDPMTILEQPEVFDLELDLVRWVKQAVTLESPPMMQKPAGLVTQFYGLDSKSR